MNEVGQLIMILVRNYNIRNNPSLKDIPLEPEMPKQCVRLESAQLNLFDWRK
jgi:hypothetical protein